jgi:hypothetical protein
MDKITIPGFMKIKGKKAILLTITALLISLLFVIIFSKENILSSSYTSQPVTTRVKVMDNYVKTIPVIIGESAGIATYNALNFVYTNDSLAGISTTEQAFYDKLESCIICGHVGNCSTSVVPCTGMNGTDLKTIGDTMSALAKTHLNLNTSFMVYGVNIIQSYPYDVDVRVDIGYTVRDADFGINWSKRENITRIVSIIGLYDPLIAANTKGVIQKKIVRSFTCEFNESCWDFNKTRTFYNEQAFTYTVEGTSFLSRYWNSTSPSECCGIESFMNITDVRNVSFLDHYYFSGIHTCSEDTLLAYAQFSPDFKLDSKTAGRYGISDNGTLICRPSS